jgi:D-alanyl-D-alanine dipeptidase
VTQHDIDVIFRSYGLVSIASVDPSVGVLLKYATDDNFMKKNLYGDLKDAYFVQEIAERIAFAQKMLRDDFPSFSLLVYDAARPMSIQRQMFKTVEGTDKEI